MSKNRMLNTRQLEFERRLVEASKRQPQRFAKLYERYFERVYAFALTRTGDRATAEDVTADTFRQALENLPRFEWRGVPFSAWLFRIASNVAADHFKRGARDRDLAIPPELDEPWENRLIEVETRARLFELVQRLPQSQRQVVTMRFGEEKSVQEIAAVMNRTQGAIKLLQHRAMTSLRLWIGDEND